MKKRIAFLALLLFLLGSLSACGAETARVPSDGRLHIVATIFPEYDWVENVLGDAAEQAEVTLLLDSGVDLHSYQPSAEDILRISTCDLFLYVGGESDAWVEDALAEATNQEMIVLNLMELLGDRAKEEELIEGMEAEEEGEEEEEEAELDEHVWLSLRNAAVLVDHIAASLAQLDPANAELYQSNAAAYREKLEALDTAYAETVAAAESSTLLFGDRFPFRYLTDDYGLRYYAAFAGCSAETEASFETVVFLADKLDELSLHTILVLEGTEPRLAETIRDNTASGGQSILVMDSMQSVTLAEIEAGSSYLSIMESNLAVLREALR